jgi:ribonuclease HI
VIGKSLIDKSTYRGFSMAPVRGMNRSMDWVVHYFFSDAHYITFKANSGRGTNNMAEFLALKTLLKLALDLGVNNLQVYGDSSFVVNWMQGNQQLHNIDLHGIGEDLKKLASAYISFRICHIFRELNQMANSLSKDGLVLPMGSILFTMVKDGISAERREDLAFG